jgi:hypothetical protein
MPTTKGKNHHRRTPPEQTPDHRQREVLRSELHDHIDWIINNLTTVERIRNDMARGYTTTNTDPATSGGGSDNSTTERLAAQHQPDPAAWATEALTQWATTIDTIRRTNRAMRRVIPLTADQLADINKLHEEAALPICGLCELPIDGKAKKIDDQPFHANTCYFKVWRTRRDAAASATQLVATC